MMSLFKLFFRAAALTVLLLTASLQLAMTQATDSLVHDIDTLLIKQILEPIPLTSDSMLIVPTQFTEEQINTFQIERDSLLGTMTLPDTAISVISADSIKTLQANSDEAMFPNIALDLIVDYGKLLTLPLGFEQKLHGALHLVMMKRFVLVGEYGYAKHMPGNAFENFEYYTSEGNYFQVGMDYKLQFNPTTFYYVGFRYGESNFSDEGKFVIGSYLWNDYTETFGTNNMQANWYEMVIGSEAALKSIRNAYVGFFLRIRILNDYERRMPVNVYSIPGYGRTFDKRIPAFNLYFRYRIFSR
ncbi:MAG: DUF6048 family protein [Cyclobacteriaceae bacterium]